MTSFSFFLSFRITYRYPDAWYVSITTAGKYYALAANHSGRLVGMIVGEMKCRHECNPEVTFYFSLTFDSYFLI